MDQTHDDQAEQLIILLHFLQFCSNKQLLDLSGLEQQNLFSLMLNFWLQY